MEKDLEPADVAEHTKLLLGEVVCLSVEDVLEKFTPK